MNKNQITEELLKRRAELAKELAEADAMLGAAGHPAAVPQPIIVPFPMPYPVTPIPLPLAPHPMTPWQPSVVPWWQIDRQLDPLNPGVIYCEKPSTICANKIEIGAHNAHVGDGFVFTNGVNAGGLS